MKRTGIIGCGNIAQVHAWVLDGMEDVEISAVCDVDQERAKKLASQYDPGSRQNVPDGGQAAWDGSDRRIKVCTDWRELCEDDLDVVHICTPHNLHAPMAAELLRHGKAVFSEKPCAVSWEQFEEMRDADRQFPGKLGFCFQNRYNNTTSVIDRMIAEGRIGTPQGGRAFVTWRRDEDYYRGSPWKGRLDTEGGGVLINQAIHTLDLLLRYLGSPSRVESTCSNHHLQGVTEVEDTMEAWLEFEGGRRACFYASNGYVSDAPVILEIEGDKGCVMMHGPEILLRSKDAQSGVEKTKVLQVEQKEGIGKGYWGSGHLACIRDFYLCLDEKKSFSGNLEGVENTFRTMMEIYGVHARSGSGEAGI